MKKKLRIDAPPHIDLSSTKAVGKNGKPLLLFRGEYGSTHGNPQEFQSALGSVSFGNVKIANIYTNCEYRYGQALMPRIYPVFLDIQNPVVNWEDCFIEYPQLVAAVGEEWTVKLLIRYEDHVYNTDNWRRINSPVKYDNVESLAKNAPHLLEEIYLDIYPILDDPDFVREAKSRGFDGAIYNGTGENAMTQEYRIFDQSQAIFALTGERAAPDLRKAVELTRMKPRVIVEDDLATSI